jgi:hypothetical protein
MASLSLMPNGERQNDILWLRAAMQRHKSILAVGNQKFPQLLFAWPTHQRMPFKNFDTVSNNLGRRDVPMHVRRCESLAARERFGGCGYRLGDKRATLLARGPLATPRVVQRLQRDIEPDLVAKLEVVGFGLWRIMFGDIGRNGKGMADMPTDCIGLSAKL